MGDIKNKSGQDPFVTYNQGDGARISFDDKPGTSGLNHRRPPTPPYQGRNPQAPPRSKDNAKAAAAALGGADDSDYEDLDQLYSKLDHKGKGPGKAKNKDKVTSVMLMQEAVRLAQEKYDKDPRNRSNSS